MLYFDILIFDICSNVGADLIIKIHHIPCRGSKGTSSSTLFLTSNGCHQGVYYVCALEHNSVCLDSSHSAQLRIQLGMEFDQLGNEIRTWNLLHCIMEL